ncbi:unnamed protein product [Staurois parvus]|uniref:Immunoglobulin C1-set domain-containing protein n=1 Tax=Staurois parvus TaxID=386267 RepID=A0ABN9B3S7_9NEOB|nr:unnamed protein product [Staurois parvus]
MRNGEDHVPSDEMTPILPHPDGTYQIRVSVEVPTKEGDTYFCHVDHSSLGDETLSVKWDPPKDNTPIIIGGCCGRCCSADYRGRYWSRHIQETLRFRKDAC